MLLPTCFLSSLLISRVFAGCLQGEQPCSHLPVGRVHTPSPFWAGPPFCTSCFWLRWVCDVVLSFLQSAYPDHVLYSIRTEGRDYLLWLEKNK